MQAKITNGSVEQYPYSFQQLKNDNPDTSFPVTPTPALFQAYGIYDVTEVQPQYDQSTHRVEEATPTLVDGVWTQTWNIIPLTEEELAQREAKRLATLEAERAYAYRTESDPLFFKAQRGEATMQEWLDKVTEIKSRYA